MVRGIADKISAPQSRDIERVRKYWKLIIDIRPEIRDIYGNIELVDQKISVDHFVPWQYVAHDELWNLHPTTKSINSSKSNNLPVWDRYFSQLSGPEYQSYKLSKENAAAKARGYSIEELERIRKEKADKRGAFDKKIFLETVTENAR